MAKSTKWRGSSCILADKSHFENPLVTQWRIIIAALQHTTSWLWLPLVSLAFFSAVSLKISHETGKGIGRELSLMEEVGDVFFFFRGNFSAPSEMAQSSAISNHAPFVAGCILELVEVQCSAWKSWNQTPKEWSNNKKELLIDKSDVEKAQRGKHPGTVQSNPIQSQFWNRRVKPSLDPLP